MFPRHLHPAILLLALAAVLAGCSGKVRKPASSVTAADKAVLAEYDAVRIALVEEDARKIRLAGERLVTALDATGVSAPLAKGKPAAERIAKNSRLDNARDAFKDVSKLVVALCADVDGYYVFDSPLIIDGRWVQPTKDVGNPFLGRAMSNLGVQK